MAMETSLSGKKQEIPHEEFLGFRISKPLLTLALQPRTLSFERLEFLGDRVLGLTVAQFVYGKYPSADVPELAKTFESVVSNDSLAGMYELLSINPSRLVSASYCAPTQSALSQKTCSDIVEAFMGAIYQQGGFPEACAFGKKLLNEHYEFEEATPIQPSKYLSLTDSNRPSTQKVAPFQDKISYKFQDILLLQEAFWHSSMGGNFYKKLDFMGVRLLALAVAEELYESYPNYEEGLLTEKFITIVSNDNLVKIFEDWQMASYLVRQSGDFSSSIPPRIAANTVRALIGAVYLDHKDWPSARSICRLLLSFKATEKRFEKPILRIMVPDVGPSSVKEPSGIVLKVRRSNHFNSVPLGIVQKIFKFVQDPDAAQLQKTNFRKCAQLPLVSKEWRETFIDVYQCTIPHYYAWSIHSVTLDELKPQIYRTLEEEGGYTNKWSWDSPWSLFEHYYALPNIQDRLLKLPMFHLSRLTVHEDFNSQNPGSFAFLRCLLPQVKLSNLLFKRLKGNDCHFLEILFEDPQASSNIQNISLEEVDLSCAHNSFLALIPLLHCQRLTLINPQGHLLEDSLEKALLSACNLKEFRIRDLRTAKNTQFAETILALSLHNNGIPRIILNTGLAMIVGRNHFGNGDPNFAERCFRIAMKSGIPEASLWLAELFLTKFTPSRQEEARMLYQNVAQDMDDDRSAAIASARLIDLFGKEEDSVKDIISRSYGRWLAFTSDDLNYNQALLDYCWVLENFCQQKGNWNFKVIDWLQNRKFIEGTPPRKNIFGAGLPLARGDILSSSYAHNQENYKKKEEENRNQSLEYLNAEIKKLYKILAKRDFLKGVIEMHKFYLRLGKLKKAEKCLKEFTQKDNPHIMLALGRFYEVHGNNREDAKRLYRQAANRNNTYAKIWVGNNILEETGDLTTCLRLHTEAAYSGNAYAAYLLYAAYQNGFFIEKQYSLPLEMLHSSQEKASYWFSVSHVSGNPWVMKNHLNTFRDEQGFDNGILYLQQYDNPFMKKSEYLNNIGYFYMKKYEFSQNEEHFEEANKNFEIVNKAEYRQSFEGISALVNLSQLYYIRSQYNSTTKADDLQRAYYNTSHLLHYSNHSDGVRRQLSGLTDEESKAFQEKGKHYQKKIEEAAKKLNIKLRSMGYD
jgi:dsRNA-specific ribonuclease/TPR repeat protein